MGSGQVTRTPILASGWPENGSGSFTTFQTDLLPFLDKPGVDWKGGLSEY